MSERPTALLTANDLILACRDVLLAGGYSEHPASASLEGARVFENPYNYVMVVTFSTWGDIQKNWAAYQAIAAESMTRQLRRDDPKVWDGYLVLMTPNVVPTIDRPAANEIRADVSRLRKLLGTGDTIRTISDVKKTLLPLLPITVESVAKEAGGSLEALPRILTRYDIPPEATSVIVESFKTQKQLMPSLHQHRTNS